ncbi:unnamed protein product [Amoebophrya sp. A120]|nr:unnamed protein product [Amoebophrya sp. A120]|eukprot:GSA120T00016629001.1
MLAARSFSQHLVGRRACNYSQLAPQASISSGSSRGFSTPTGRNESAVFSSAKTDAAEESSTVLVKRRMPFHTSSTPQNVAKKTKKPFTDVQDPLHRKRSIRRKISFNASLYGKADHAKYSTTTSNMLPLQYCNPVALQDRPGRPYLPHNVDFGSMAFSGSAKAMEASQPVLPAFSVAPVSGEGVFTTMKEDSARTTGASEQERHDGAAQHDGVPVFDVPRIRRELANVFKLAKASAMVDEKAVYEDAASPWLYLDKEMSSNLAGETGAVSIYNGAIFAAQQRLNLVKLFSRHTTSSIKTQQHFEKVLAFSQKHCEAEKVHLSVLTQIYADLPAAKHTKLLPMWRVCGFTLGFLPTFFGGGVWLYHTVEAVETFVEKHYQHQLRYLRKMDRQLIAAENIFVRRNSKPEVEQCAATSESKASGVDGLVAMKTSEDDTNPAKEVMEQPTGASTSSFSRKRSTRNPYEIVPVTKTTKLTQTTEETKVVRPCYNSYSDMPMGLLLNSTTFASNRENKSALAVFLRLSDAFPFCKDMQFEDDSGKNFSKKELKRQESLRTPISELQHVHELARFLDHCCADEVDHKKDAETHLLEEVRTAQNGPDRVKSQYSVTAFAHHVWRTVVYTGSACAASLAKVI